jgi:hypothetical protein
MTKNKIKSQLKHLIIGASNNAKSCKMTITSPFTLVNNQ